MLQCCLKSNLQYLTEECFKRASGSLLTERAQVSIFQKEDVTVILRGTFRDYEMQHRGLHSKSLGRRPPEVPEGRGPPKSGQYNVENLPIRLGETFVLAPSKSLVRTQFSKGGLVCIKRRDRDVRSSQELDKVIIDLGSNEASQTLKGLRHLSDLEHGGSLPACLIGNSFHQGLQKALRIVSVLSASAPCLPRPSAESPEESDQQFA